MRYRESRFLVLLLALALCGSGAPKFPGTSDQWNGYRRHSFSFDSRQCFVVQPDSDAPGKPWIWRARFWGHRPEVDLALLDRGFHLAYMDVAEMLGNQQAVTHWNAFYNLLTTEYGFSAKPALEGMSRGGLYVYAWAADNPGKVSAIYADAPVCDIKSWPLMLRNGPPSERAWKMVQTAFGFRTLEEATGYTGNPIDRLAPLAQARVPLIHVHGDADTTVPLAENTAIVERRYKEMGGEMVVIVKPGVAHKHGLDDPTPVIQFLLRHTLTDPTAVVPEFQDGETVVFAGEDRRLRGWHRYVSGYYRTRFPGRRIRFVEMNATGPFSSAVVASGSAKAVDLMKRLSARGVRQFVLIANGTGREDAQALQQLAAKSSGGFVDLHVPESRRGKADMLLRTYEFLRAQDVPALVSKITVGTADSSNECIRCVITVTGRGANSLVFDVKESSLPMPVDDEVKSALASTSFERRLNQEILMTPAFAAGLYRLFIDGKPVGEFPANALRAGVNLALNPTTPQYRQARAVTKSGARPVLRSHHYELRLANSKGSSKTPRTR